MPPDTMKNILDLYFGGDMEAAVGLAGQTSGLIDGVKPVADIISEMVVEFHQISARMGALASGQSF